MEKQRHLSHARSPKLARGTEVTERSKFAQGAEVSRNARNQERLFSSHFSLPSMPAAAPAGSPVCGPLERTDAKDLFITWMHGVCG